MKITVLIENTTDSDLQCEHGLSLYIEYNEQKILLDAGSSDTFIENAKQLGVDLTTVDMAFLSHGHYDHSGGFCAFAEENSKAPVYAMESAFGEYASTSGGTLHKIGIPEPVKACLRDRCIKVNEVKRICEGITLVPHHTPDLKRIGKRVGLYYEENGEWVPDNFSHEMSVVFETAEGLVVCNSCSHGGVKNIVEEVKVALPGKKVYAYVGGLHMKGRKDDEDICTFTREEVKELADYIQGENIQMLITGHCTGNPAMKLLREELEDRRLLEMCSGKTFYMNV